MKTMTKFLAATAVALTMGATSAAQAAIFISIDGSTDLYANVAVDAFGKFSQDFKLLTNAQRGGFESLVVDGNVGIFPEVLSSRSVNANSTGAANVNIWVTQTDLTLAQAAYFLSSYSFNATRTWSGSAATFVSDKNAKYTGAAAGSWNFAALSCTKPSCGQGQDVSSLGQIDVSNALYSVTHQYNINSNGKTGSGDISARTSALVPEPGTWALMIMGFGGAGAMLRSRRRSLAAVA